MRRSRPGHKYISGIGIGLLAFVLSGFVLSDLEMSTRAIVCWDLTCLWFVALTLTYMRKQTLSNSRSTSPLKTKDKLSS